MGEQRQMKLMELLTEAQSYVDDVAGGVGSPSGGHYCDAKAVEVQAKDLSARITSALSAASGRAPTKGE